MENHDPKTASRRAPRKKTAATGAHTAPEMPAAVAPAPSLEAAIPEPPAKKAAKKSPAAPAAPAKKPKPAKARRIRGKFTLPDADYARIAKLKLTARRSGLKVKKNELIALGLQALQTLKKSELHDRILTLRLPGRRTPD